MRKVKVVTAVGMFYDLEDPSTFIRDISLVLHEDGIFVAQLMCLKQTLDKLDIGNFAHEHLEFYTIKSLKVLFGKFGLEIFELEENSINGGSYRLFIGHKNKRPIHTSVTEAESLEDQLSIERWLSNVERNRIACLSFIRQEKAAGKRIWVYGASTKGNVILQHYGLDATMIDAAADRDPNKWGKYTIATGIPITSEEQFRAARPDFAFMLPYAFRTEMLTRESEYRAVGGKFIVPLPEFEVV